MAPRRCATPGCRRVLSGLLSSIYCRACQRKRREAVRRG